MSSQNIDTRSRILEATWKLLEGNELDQNPSPDSSPETDDPILQHPVVQTALDIFGGTARAIESDDSKEIP